MTTWQVYDARLGVAGPFHVRIERPEGKTMRWRTPAGYGLGDHRLEDLVYGGPLAPGDFVVITEGERAADAVRRAGMLGIGTVCGASSTPGRHVVEMFTDVHVTLWPDADGVGRDHMARIARLLEPIVATMAMVDIPGTVPTGWDAADATEGEIYHLVTTARDIWLRRPEPAVVGR